MTNGCGMTLNVRDELRRTSTNKKKTRRRLSFLLSNSPSFYQLPGQRSLCHQRFWQDHLEPPSTSVSGCFLDLVEDFHAPPPNVTNSFLFRGLLAPLYLQKRKKMISLPEYWAPDPGENKQTERITMKICPAICSLERRLEKQKGIRKFASPENDGHWVAMFLTLYSLSISFWRTRRWYQICVPSKSCFYYALMVHSKPSFGFPSITTSSVFEPRERLRQLYRAAACNQLWHRLLGASGSNFNFNTPHGFFVA